MKKGWYWHLSLYNYLTGEKKCFNSEEPVENYKKLLEELRLFLEELDKKESEDSTLKIK